MLILLHFYCRPVLSCVGPFWGSVWVKNVAWLNSENTLFDCSVDTNYDVYMSATDMTGDIFTDSWTSYVYASGREQPV
jgi:hypothetical protein